MSGTGDARHPSGPAFGPEGLERRRALRMPSSFRISVVGARLLNASPFGMLIESPVPMERDAVLRLRLVVSGEKLDVETRVAACTPLPERSNAWGVGLEFARLPEATLEKLRAALSQPPPV